MIKEVQFDSNNWVEYYKNKPVNPNRIAEMANRHSLFLNRIIEESPLRAIEVGVGTGVLGYSLLQKSENIQVTELDINKSMLQDVKKSLITPGLHYAIGDTFNLPFSSSYRNSTAIFHQGLLEHFPDEQIRIMIQEQLRVASTVIASVPSENFAVMKDRIRGDERLMNKEAWESILNLFNCHGEYYGENPGEKYHICLTIKK